MQSFLRTPLVVLLAILPIAGSYGQRVSSQTPDETTDNLKQFWNSLKSGTTLDPKTADALFQWSLARPNDPEALFVRAELIKDHDIDGSDADWQNAMNEAVKLGSAPAEASLGFYLSTAKDSNLDPRRGRLLLEQAAARNEPLAFYRLGRIYFYGAAGIPQDFSRAEEYFLKARAMGVTYANVWLAQMQASKGRTDEALATLTGLAKSGVAAAQVALSGWYAQGYFTAPNPDSAYFWATKAVDTTRGRIPEYLYVVGECQELGVGTRVNLDQAKASYKKSYAEGYAGAGLAIVNLYQKDGFGSAQESASILRQLTAKGNADAELRLADALIHGTLVPQNLSEAKQILSSPTLENNADAISLLGEISLASTRPALPSGMATSSVNPTNPTTEPGNLVAEYEIDPANRWLLVPVSWEGLQGFFIVDSGTGFNILDSSTFSSLKKSAEASDENAQSSIRPEYEPPHMRAGPFNIAHCGSVARADLANIRIASGKPIIGILSVASFQDAVLQVDVGTHRMRFLQFDRNEHPDWGTSVPIQMSNGIPTVKIKVQGIDQEISADVDIGANDDLRLGPELFTKMLAINRSATTTEQDVQIGRVSLARVLQNGSIDLGPLKFDKVGIKETKNLREGIGLGI
jgi:TPR repeat protein